MSEQFVSEPLTPESASADTTAMARGEPGLPRSFSWRGGQIEVARLLETWKTNAAAGEAKAYLRRHWFKVVCTDGRTVTLYFLRQAKPHHPRWWLYSIHVDQ